MGTKSRFRDSVWTCWVRSWVPIYIFVAMGTYKQSRLHRALPPPYLPFKWSQVQETGVKDGCGQEPSAWVHSNRPQACFLSSEPCSCLELLTSLSSNLNLLSLWLIWNLLSGLLQPTDSFCAPSIWGTLSISGETFLPVHHQIQLATGPQNPTVGCPSPNFMCWELRSQEYPLECKGCQGGCALSPKFRQSGTARWAYRFAYLSTACLLLTEELAEPTEPTGAIEGTFTNGNVLSPISCAHCSAFQWQSCNLNRLFSLLLQMDLYVDRYTVYRSLENSRERQAFLCLYVSVEFEGRHFAIWKSASLRLNEVFTGS